MLLDNMEKCLEQTDWKDGEKAAEHALFVRLFAHSASEDQPLQLHQLFPFLKNTAVQDQELPRTNLEHNTIHKLPRLMMDLSAADKFRKVMEPFVPLREGELPRGRFLKVAAKSSSVDVMHSFPLLPGVKNGVALVEVQIKTLQLETSAIRPSILYDDCIAKAAISDKEGELTLHILSSSKMHTSLLEMIPASGVLVLKGGDTFNVFTGIGEKNKKTHVKTVPKNLILVVLSPKKAEDWTNQPF